MSATLKLPSAAPDPARMRRLESAWRDEDVTTQDLRARGFTAGEINHARRAFGLKPQKTAMPEFGRIRTSLPKGFRRWTR